MTVQYIQFFKAFLLFFFFDCSLGINKAHSRRVSNYLFYLDLCVGVIAFFLSKLFSASYTSLLM